MDIFLTLVGFDVEGRTVIPSRDDDIAFSWSVLEGSFDQLEITRFSHRWTIKACGGSGLLRLSYMGTEIDMPLEIGPDHATEACALTTP